MRPTTNPSTEPIADDATASFDLAAARRAGQFGFVLEGDALAPRFRRGDMLAADAHRLPRPGDVVILRRAGDGQLGACILNADGDAYTMRGHFIDRGRFVVLGTVFGVERAAGADPLGIE